MKKALLFLPEGVILPISFSDEGKQAVRRAVLRERGQVKARSGA